jgi:hypothetical protein
MFTEMGDAFLSSDVIRIGTKNPSFFFNTRKAGARQ